MANQLKKRIRDLKIAQKRSQDIDPEDGPGTSEAETSDSDSVSEDNDEDAGREHYEKVAESKLRKPASIELDPTKYGSRPISRTNIDDNEYNDPLAPQEDSDEDPFAARDEDLNEDFSEVSASEHVSFGADEDEEIDSDEAFAEGEEAALRTQGFIFRGSRSGGMLDGPTDHAQRSMSDVKDDDSDEMDKNDENSEDPSDTDTKDTEDEDDNISDVDGTESDYDSDQSQESTGLNVPLKSSRTDFDLEQLRNLISSDTATISATLSQAASADAQKGNAIKQQYQAFDRFLDARIKLQKGLTAVNDLNVSSMSVEDEIQSAAQKAEMAALQLFSTIESIRNDIVQLQSQTTESDGKKRKRPSPVTHSTSITDIRDRLDELESQCIPHRRAVIDKWANKTRAANVSSLSRSKLQADQANSKLTTVLDAYLLSSLPKLVQDSKTPTTTAPSTTIRANTIENERGQPEPTLPPYQDTLFYQSLLRDLIATKSYINPSSTNNASATLTYNINDRTALPAKIHRQVDRKASKGRKIRYTVHEKLENFMASTGRLSVGNQWTEAATREFFGSLMGMRNQLAEYSDEGENPDGLDDGYNEYDRNGEVEALKLFRS